MDLKSGFLKLSEINLLKKFISKNWNSKHIFLKSNDLLKWQHKFRNNKLDFFVLKQKKKIVSLLGIINQSRDLRYSEISLAIWISKQRSAGSRLFLNLENEYNFKIIKGTTVNKKIIPMYTLLGFVVKKFNIFYLTYLNSEKQNLSKNLFPSKLLKTQRLKVIKFNELKDIKNINLNYLNWRFVKHPIYKYYFITDQFKKLILVYRILKVKNFKIMRIVDFIGSFKKKKNFIKKLNFFIYENNIEYVEFFHYGFEDSFIRKSGLKKLNKDQKIVIYTEPYKGLINDDFYCCYKTKKINKIKIVRADGDFDRPSVI